MTSTEFPDRIENEADLDELLTRPNARLIEAVKSLASPLLVLGAGGKMGPTLAVLAKRAAEIAGRDLQVVAVSRFSNAAARQWLEERGIRTIAADLLCRDEVRQLPDSANVLHLVGLKFGTQTNPSMTWAVNTIAPALVAERYARARLVVLSTGNVYPLRAVTDGGAAEDSPLTPVGEYANAAVARERILEYLSQRNQTPMTILRLSYAVEMRYGVLLDIALRVHAGQPVDLTTGYLNCLWQGDANDMILRSFPLAATPPRPLNLTGPEVLSVRSLASQFAAQLGREVTFSGAEAPTALLSNTGQMQQRLGMPATPLDAVIRWIVHWVKAGGRILGKPTHFEVRDGKY